MSKSTSVEQMVLCEHEWHIGFSVTGHMLQPMSSSPYVHIYRSTRKSGAADSGAKMDKVETPTNWKEFIPPHLIIQYPFQYYLLIAVNAPRRATTRRLFDQIIVYLICSEAYWSKTQSQRSYASYHQNFKLAD